MRLLACLLLLLLPVPAAAAREIGQQALPSVPTPLTPGDTNISVETDLRQIAVGCALILAGYDAPATMPETTALRSRVRNELQQVGGDLLVRLREFYSRHRREGVEESTDAARYRALAVLLNPLPSLSVGVSDLRVPEDLRPLVGFAALTGELARTPAFRALLPALLQSYTEVNVAATRQLRPTVMGTLDYFHTIPVRQIDVPAQRAEDGKLIRPALTRIRRLKIYPDPLLAGGGAFVRDDLTDAADEPDNQRVGDRYAVFAGGAVQTDEAGVRLSLLRFVLDPLIEKYSADLEQSASTIDALVRRSPSATERYKDQSVALVIDSLVSAADARLRVRLGVVTEASAHYTAAQAYERGQVLALHCYDRLRRFEEVGVDIGVFFPEFLRSIDTDREGRRSEEVAEARARAAAEGSSAREDAFARAVLRADELVTSRRFAEARPILEELLRSSPNNARALFGLAQVLENLADPVELNAATPDADRAAAQAERLERAVDLYRRAAATSNSRELWLASWSHVYAGRILDFLDLRDEAVAEYAAAVKIGDVPKGAFKEAAAGVEAPWVPVGRP
jgi:tetratricopeptide (TPR) repeat protein